MPHIGTIVRAQLRAGHLAQFGTPWQSIDGTAPYDGIILGVWYVAESHAEPEQIDVLAVPPDLFQTFMAIAQGADPNVAVKNMEAKLAAALVADSKLPANQRRGPPSAMRRSYLMKDGPVAFYEATLTMTQAFDHFNDRREAAEEAFEEDDEDDLDDATDSPAAAQSGSPLPLPQQPPYPYAPNGQ